MKSLPRVLPLLLLHLTQNTFAEDLISPASKSEKLPKSCELENKKKQPHRKNVRVNRPEKQESIYIYCSSSAENPNKEVVENLPTRNTPVGVENTIAILQPASKEKDESRSSLEKIIDALAKLFGSLAWPAAAVFIA